MPDAAMFVRNAWYVAAWCHDVAKDEVLARTIIDQPLVLYRKHDGAVVALEDRCCHRLAPLSKGRREGDDLRCMYHGLKFAPDGRCIEIPGQALIPPRAVVRSYPVVERGNWVWIWMGDAARADLSQIPATIAATDPAWRFQTGHIDYAAHAQLINDNLLDLSHLSFVHEKTLGRNTPQWASERPNVTALPRGVRFQRWIQNRGPSHYYGKPGELYDLWHSYDFLVPGIFLQKPAWYPPGTAQRYNLQPPVEPALFVRLDEQAVTPMSNATSRYFYATGARSADAGAALADEMFRFTETAFYEDKDIIEAQQKVIALDPDRPMLSMSFDAGPNLFRGIVRQLLAAEAPQPERALAAAQGD
jgi:phenylpropionate dioxygenase-like ring-hydroxylating dioxygenase large terminal subunit